MKKIAFIINSRIKKKKKVIADIKTVFDSTYDKQILTTRRKGHACDLAKEALKDKYVYLISVGGDGTLNEVINGVMQTINSSLLSNEDLEKIKVGILPYGSGNDFSRTLKIVADFHQLRMCIDRDAFNKIDIGFASYVDSNNNPKERYFINIADIGMGAEVARKIDSYTKLFGPNFAYQRGILSTLITYKSSEVIVESATYQYSGKLLNLVLANGKYFGSGLGIAPDASVTNKKISVVNIGDIGVVEYLKQIGKVRRCVKLTHSAISYSEAEDIQVKSINTRLPFEMDGEFVGYTPVSVKVVSSAINVLSPK